MNVTDAIETRRACRAFLDKPVPKEVIEEILQKATRSPSGGNLQPWRIYVVGGEVRDQIVKEVKSLVSHEKFDFNEGADYNVYPPNLKEPYRTRRYQIGEALYGALDISREDKRARLKWFTGANYEFFGAKTAFFFTMDRCMQEGQWADLGMFMQSIMLLAREYGLHTVPQESWAPFGKTLKHILSIPENEMLFCGMGIGYEDPDSPLAKFRSERAPLEEIASFHGL